MKNTSINFLLFTLLILNSACSLMDFHNALDTASVKCKSHFANDPSLAKSCQKGVDNLQYTVVRNADKLQAIEDAKFMCDYSFENYRDDLNACYKGIELLREEGQKYASNANKLGERKETSSFAILDRNITTKHQPGDSLEISSGHGRVRQI